MPSNSASSMADTLWPYLIKRVAATRGGNGHGGSVIPGGRLATLQDVNLGPLSDGQVLTYDSSTQMWRNEDPTGDSGGGSTYVAGNGIAISGSTIATKQQTAGGLDADSNGLYIKHPSDSGLVIDSTGIHIGEGIGIDVLGGVTSVDATEITDTTQGLGVNSNKIYLRVGSNSGLHYNPDGSLRLGTPSDLAWNTSNQLYDDGHTHNILSSADESSSGQTILLHAAAGNLGLKSLDLNGDLDFILGTHNITASNHLHIRPKGDLYLESLPAGYPTTVPDRGNVIFPDDQVMRTPTFNQFIAGIAGWTIADLGANQHQLSITSILVDNLFAKKFTADEARVQRGEWFLTRSFGIVETSFNTPSVGATVDVWFEEAPGTGTVGTKLFLPDNWIEFRTIDWSRSLIIQTVWYQVIGVGATDYIQREDQSPTGDKPSRQQWRIKRMAGGFAGARTSKGEVGADFGIPQTSMPAGQPGQGTIYASSLYQPDFGPFIELQVFDHVTSNVPVFKNKVRMGNLQSTVDYTGIAWGFAAADDLSLAPSAGMSGFAVDTVKGMRMFNTDITLYGAGIPVLNLNRAMGMSIRQDNGDLNDPVRMIAWYPDLDAPSDQRFAAVGSYLYYDGTYERNIRILNLRNYSGHTAETAMIRFDASEYGRGASMSIASYGILSDGTVGSTGGIGADEVVIRDRLGVGTYIDFAGDIATLHVMDNTTGDSGKRVGLMIEQYDTGDAVMHWHLSGGRYYSAGIDNDDGDKFKITNGASLGATAFLTFNPADGKVTLNGLDVGGSTPPSGLLEGDGIDITGSYVAVDSSVARTATTISAGAGMIGGGDLSLNRTLSVRLASASGLNTTAGLAIDDSLAGTGLYWVSPKVLGVSPGANVPGSRQIIADAPLSGGGALTADVHIGLALEPVDPGLTYSGGQLAVDGSVVRVTRAIITNPGSGLTGGSTLVGNVTLALEGDVVRDSVHIYTDAGSGLKGGGDLSDDRHLAIDLNPTTPGLSTSGGLTVDTSVVRTSRQINTQTGSGLKGGGDLGNHRDLAILLAATDPGLSTTTGLTVDATVVRTSRSITTLPDTGLQGGRNLGADVPLSILLKATNPGLLLTGGLAVDFSKVVSTGRVLTAGAGMTGGGDLTADRTFNVIAGDGSLTVSPDSMVVNRAFNFTWSGTHQFDSNVKLNAGLDFIGSTRSITSPATINLSILPGGDLILDPGGFNVLPGGGTRTDLGDYNRKWSTVYARELYVETLVASSVMATIGGRVMVTPTTSLIVDTNSTQLTIDVKHAIASFGGNTYLYLESAPGNPPVPQIEAMRINAATFAASPYFGAPLAVTVGGVDGYRYPVLRGRNSSGAKSWLAGDAVVSLGTAVSDGYIDLASVQTARNLPSGAQKIGPTITIYSRSATTNWDDLVPTVTMGNLTSFVDYSTTRFGFATGNDLTLQPDGTNPFIGMTADRTNGVRLFNTPLNLYNVGNAILTIDKTNGISFEHGTSLFNTIGWYEDLGTPPSAPDPAKLIGTVGVARATAGYTETDIVSTGIAGSYPTGAVKLRAIGPGSAQYNVWADSSGVYFGSGSGVRSQTGGYISDAVQYFSGNLWVGASADSSPVSRLYVYKSPPPGGSDERVATLRMTATSPNTTRTTTVLSVESAPGGTGFNNVFEIGIDIALRAEQAVGRPIALRANQGDVQVLAGWLGVGMTPTVPLDVVGAAHINGNTWVGNATVDTTPSSRLYVYKTPSSGAADERAATIYLSGNTTTATRTMTVLYLQSNPGGTGVGSNNEIGIDIALRGIQAAGRPIALHADNGDLILDNGRIGVGVSPTHPLHLLSNNASIAGVGMLVEQAGAGDARIQFTRAVQNWVIGVDGSNNDVFAISPSTDLSTGSSIGLSYRTNGMLGINNNNPGAYLQVGPLTPTVQTPSGIWVGPNAASTGVMVVNNGGMTMGLLASTNGNAYLGAWTNHPLIFRTNNADRITIAAAGGITIPGLITANGGVSFGNETLNTYDEGAYTPAIVADGGTSPTLGSMTRTGSYVQIGNVVFFSGSIAWLSKTGGTSSALVAITIPSAPVNNKYATGTLISSNTTIGMLYSNSTNAYMDISTTAGQMTVSTLPAAGAFIFSGFYFVA